MVQQVAVAVIPQKSIVPDRILVVVAADVNSGIAPNLDYVGVAVEARVGAEVTGLPRVVGAIDRKGDTTREAQAGLSLWQCVPRGAAARFAVAARASASLPWVRRPKSSNSLACCCVLCTALSPSSPFRSEGCLCSSIDSSNW